ncbi:hypothetical protein IW262DRAFT_1297283 [Armillaria fumosa]|nr:hypothetical protein IW262DRAFT_1297283 [Armillaria fumosa]
MANSASSAPPTPTIIHPALHSLLFDNGSEPPNVPVIKARLARLEAEISEIRTETATHFTSIDQRLNDMGNVIKQLAGDVNQIGLTLRNVQLVHLTQHRRAQIADRRSSLYQRYDSLVRKLDIARNSEQERAIEDQLDALSKSIDEADEQLTEVDQVITSSLAPLNYLPQNLTATFPATFIITCPPPIPIAAESVLTPKQKRLRQAASRWKGTNDVKPVGIRHLRAKIIDVNSWTDYTQELQYFRRTFSTYNRDLEMGSNSGNTG